MSVEHIASNNLTEKEKNNDLYSSTHNNTTIDDIGKVRAWGSWGLGNGVASYGVGADDSTALCLNTPN